MYYYAIKYIGDQACKNRAYLDTNFVSLLNFNSILLHTYSSYLNEIFKTYLKIHNISYKAKPFSEHVLFVQICLVFAGLLFLFSMTYNETEKDILNFYYLLYFQALRTMLHTMYNIKFNS